MKKFIQDKLGIAILGLALIGGLATSAVAVASAATTDASTSVAASQTRPQMTPPTAMGKVTAVSGDTITITDQKSGTTYTVDASSATVSKDKTTSASVSDIAVGDMIAVDGTVSGTSITATAIHDGFGPGGFGGRGGPGGPGGVMGTVSAINGSTLTVTAEGGGTYTVDASSATVDESGATSSLSDVKVGDTVMIRGSVTTASMTAQEIEDGVATPPAHQSSTTTTQS